MYLNIDEVDTAVVNLAAQFPTLCELITLPETSIEGRTCHALRVGSAPAAGRDAVLLLGGVHAREWGSCEILINLVTDLFEAYTQHTGLGYGGTTFRLAEVTAIVDGLNILVFPLVNPDGRAFSQSTAPGNSDPLWRKNRNPASSGGDPAKIGVDINRNYDVLWDFRHLMAPIAATYTSDDPARETFHGPAAFSEPETRNVRWLLEMFPRIRWCIDIHSYQEDMLFNWGDDENQSADPSMNLTNSAFDAIRGKSGDAYKEFIPQDDWDTAQALANTFKAALQGVRGRQYTAKQSYYLYPTSGASDDYVYNRHLADPMQGKVLGFVIEWGKRESDDKHSFHPDWSEMELIIKDVTAGLIAFCLSAPCGGGSIAVTQETQTINFIDVPAGEETVRAAVFSIVSCSSVTIQVLAGPQVTSGPGAFGLPLGGVLSLPAASGSAARQLLFWISFRGTNPGDVTDGTIRIQANETGETFDIPIHANTVARPRVAATLVLDKSNSMTFDAGDGRRRIDVLHDAAPVFVDVLQEHNAIGIVSFDQDAYPVMPVTEAGAPGPFELTRTTAKAAIAAHVPNPQGWTAIGDGLEAAHGLLDGVTGYDSRAIIVLTDGQETAHKYISEVAPGLINDTVYAIGLGTPEEINPAALQALTNGTGGYVLMTGTLDVDDRFTLTKYYLQILAAVSNQEIVRDPTGSIRSGEVHTLDFLLNEADGGADVMLITPAPGVIRFRLRTPAGQLIDPAMVGTVPGLLHVRSSNVAFYRMTLPLLLNGSAQRPGTWQAVLDIDASGYTNYLTHVSRDAAALAHANTHGLPYSLTIQAFSSLRMNGRLAQSSTTPGAILRLRVALTEYGLPVEGRATVTALLTMPDGTKQSLDLAENDPGIFEGSVTAWLTGVFEFLIHGEGTSIRGTRFTREQILTGMVWTEVGVPQDPSGAGHSCNCLCQTIRCLLKEPRVTSVVEEKLQREGIDVRLIRAALKRCCENQSGGPIL